MSLIRNTFWNLSGYVIPSAIAIPALGFLARALGPERFGLFTLAVALVGYASIFDAGLTRGVIREVSFYRDNKDEVNKIVSNSTIILTFLGMVGGGCIFIFAPIIVNFLNTAKNLHGETLLALKLLGITLPFFSLNQYHC